MITVILWILGIISVGVVVLLGVGFLMWIIDILRGDNDEGFF